MKKIILLALLVMIMVGCMENDFEIEKSSKVFVDITYDSCEYVYSNISDKMAHKGNCKFCEERDSIKWEKRKKELVELISKLLDDK